MKFCQEFGCTTASGPLQMATEVCRLDYADPSERITMAYFLNLKQIVESLEADEMTKSDPIKRAFVIQGKHLTAEVGVVRETVNALHTQSSHDEVLVIIEGGVRFRVGKETQLVS